MWNVYLPLLTYKHVAGPTGRDRRARRSPRRLPTVSNGGKTYKLKLRSGLKYSNGKPVKASDFKYAIKRLFLIDSPGVGFFTDIVGADAVREDEEGRHLRDHDDDQTGDITINLTAPQGDFQNILATTFAALVPTGTPTKDQSTHPIPATGPYMIQSYSRTSSSCWCGTRTTARSTAVPTATRTRSPFKIVEDDAAALQQVINGQAD